VNSASLLALTGNSLITELALFDTELNDMSNFANDFRVTKTFEMAGGEITANAGYFKMVQNFEQTWHWGRFLISTEDSPSIINVPGFTEAGVYTYNGAFGACCNIFWDMQADVDAIYGGLNATFGSLNLDGSIRNETMHYDGFARFQSPRNVDVNKDGTIGPAEIGVPINDPASGGTIGGNLSGTSYSMGANYKINDDLAIFTRYSRGITWNFDRQFGAFTNGAITSPGSLRNTTRQIEGGVKWRETGSAIPGNLSVYLTYFNGRANLVNFSITTNQSTGGIYGSNGLEFEFNYDNGGLNLFGNGAYTDAKVKRDFNNPARSGLRPIRQAKFIYNFGASYTYDDRFTLGGAVNGTTKSFVDFENRFVMPSFTTVSAFASFKATDRLTLGINANNLFNKAGFTEGDEGRLFDTDGNGAYDTSIARSIAGRTISASVKFDF
jgi:outer membrane receptor protein involved in Fe transport